MPTFAVAPTPRSDETTPTWSPSGDGLDCRDFMRIGSCVASFACQPAMAAPSSITNTRSRSLRTAFTKVAEYVMDVAQTFEGSGDEQAARPLARPRTHHFGCCIPPIRAEPEQQVSCARTRLEA